MKHQRLLYLDIARSLGILTVVWGHHCQYPVFQILYSFHIPLFFFIGGVVFDYKREGDFSTFARKKAMRLIKPYFIFSFILFLKWLLLGIVQNEIESKLTVVKHFLGIFYAQGGGEYMSWGVPMWFLPCLFLANIIYWHMDKRLKNSQYILTFLTAALFLLFMILNKYDLELPWSADTAFIGIFYFHLGVLYNSKMKKKSLSLIQLLLILMALVVLTIVTSLNNERLDLYYHTSGNIFFHLISSVSGILFIIILSKQLIGFKPFYFINKHSIPILAFHTTIGGYLLIAIKIITGYSGNNGYLSLFYSILQITIVVLGCVVFNRFNSLRLSKSRVLNSIPEE